MTRILIIDDEDLFREDLALILQHCGYSCRTAANATKGVKAAREFVPDVILCDLVMPDKSGLEILGELRACCPESHVIMVTAYGNLESAVEAFRGGAVDYILKPIAKEDVLQKIGRLEDFNRLDREIKTLRRILSQQDEQQRLIGHSSTIRKIFELIETVGRAGTTVLVTGESGTGKEIVAREIHRCGKPSDSPFIAINCASIPGELLESELFGHVRGAFTGAAGDRKGYFELAESGTVLLDEIGDMPLNLQGKLLRVLEEKEYFRVGDTQPKILNARVIASTNKELSKLVESGAFREDLFYRINVFEIHVPPLKEHRSDIPLLADFFVTKYNKELKRKCAGFDNESMQVLMSYSWPGNVRQLRNVVERAMILTQEQYITIGHLSEELTGGNRPVVSGESLKDAVKAFEIAYITRVLDATQGNREEAARRLGINPSTLYRKMPDLNLG